VILKFYTDEALVLNQLGMNLSHYEQLDFVRRVHMAEKNLSLPDDGPQDQSKVLLADLGSVQPLQESEGADLAFVDAARQF
jgi:hypothetical protein